MTLSTASHTDAPSEKIHTERSAYLWNTASGLLMAFQSVIMLTVLTHVCDTVTAGVFTIAYANANLFLNLGKYGIRNFQVSDVCEKYSFRTYLFARVVSVVAMLAFGAAWLLWSASSVGYTLDKSLTILMMLVFKAIDALEDVFHGNYQQHGRLDVGARVLTLRLITMIALYVSLIVATRNLLLSLTITTAFTGLFFVGETLWAKRRYGLPISSPDAGGTHTRHRVALLLKESFPVFLALFLLFYIGNAPKYAIDATLDDTAQAYYGFIAMPVFVVGLLAGFIYNPIIASLAENWAEGKVSAFARRFALQVLIIAGITVVCIIGAWIIGIPVLNLLYNADLEPYKIDLVVLLVGGGFLATATLFTTGITIIRWQKKLTLGYVVVSLLALILSPVAVQTAGIDGASWIYLALMIILTLWFGAVFAVGIKRGSRS